MATTKYATIKLYEAYAGDSYGTTFSSCIIPNMMQGPEAILKDVPFTTVDELVKKGAAFAEYTKETSGHGYWVSFNLPKGARKPPGFDAKTKNLWVALTPEPESLRA